MIKRAYPTYANAKQTKNYGMLGQPSGLASMMPALANKKNSTEGQLSALGYTFNPFTGNAKGISAGKRSMADALVNNNLYASTPTFNDLFPLLSQSQYVQPTQQAQSPTSGAGRFLGTTK